MKYFASYQVTMSSTPDSDYVIRSMANHVVDGPTPLTPRVVEAIEKFLTNYVGAHPETFGVDADVVLVHVVPLSHDTPGEPAPEIRDGFA